MIESKVLLQLLNETWKSPVFGDSFGREVTTQTKPVLQQMQAIWQGLGGELQGFLAQGMPELQPREVKAIVQQIAPKTVGFCPALVAGELSDIPRLQAVAMAIALMYWGDQTMDRGDEAMPLAIELLTGDKPKVLAALEPTVQARLKALQGIAVKIAEFALPEDRALVLDCFDQQVLANEVRLHRLSLEYMAAKDQQEFLAAHAAKIASYMTIDAGFPSVSSSLYAIYRQHNKQLPPLAEVYADPVIVSLLQTCNAVVRVLDELGDWPTDAGKNPEWGSFCLNLFNQAHPDLLREFLALAGVKGAQAAQLTKAFTKFHENDATREKYGQQIIESFLTHVRQTITSLPAPTKKQHSHYIMLCKRVLEIGYVNRIGDVALGSSEL